MLTAMTLALPPRTNIPRPTKKNPKDTPNRDFNKIDWDQINGTEGVLFIFTLLYRCTVVQDQCTIVALYYCITSVPVYPNTLHGHCTTNVSGFHAPKHTTP